MVGVVLIFNLVIISICNIYSFQATTTTSSINAAGRNAVVTALMVCCGFVVCVTPCQIVACVGNFTSSLDYRSWLYHCTLVLVEFNSCINSFSENSTPVVCQCLRSIGCLSGMISILCINCFIYAAKYRDFQQAVRRLVSRNQGTGIETNATANASSHRDGQTGSTGATELQITNQ